MKPALAILVAFAAGVALGVVATRVGADGSVLTGDQDTLRELLTAPRAWLVFAAVLALITRGPLTGAAAGAAAMFGLLLALQVLPWHVDLSGAAGDSGQLRQLVDELYDGGDWIDVTLIVAAAVVGAAIGTVRLVLRTGRRLLLAAAAVAVVVAIVAGWPAIHDALRPEITIIR